MGLQTPHSNKRISKGIPAFRPFLSTWHAQQLFANMTLENHNVRYLMTSSHFDREKLTIRKMVTLYCLAKEHSVSGLCSRCSDVLFYAYERIEACSYLPGKKPACGLCRSNCFDVNRRRQFAEIMRRAGLRMMMHHPLLTVAHLMDAIRNRSQ